MPMESKTLQIVDEIVSASDAVEEQTDAIGAFSPLLVVLVRQNKSKKTTVRVVGRIKSNLNATFEIGNTFSV